MTVLATIELFKEAMKFSAGHFTIFSATHRENLHGHNFTLHVELSAEVSEEGLVFDYRAMKERLIELCKQFNEIVLLPERNPHLLLRRENGRVFAQFNGEELVFLDRDVKLLPIRNVTVEELASYLLGIISSEIVAHPDYRIVAAAVRVFSGPGQSARVQWSAA